MRSFQVALHLHPLDHHLWEKDLRWALHLQKHAVLQKIAQDDQTQQRTDKFPELQQEYGDFECDEVIDACMAIADRQKRKDELKPNVIVDVQDVANEMLVTNSDKIDSKYILVKARII